MMKIFLLRAIPPLLWMIRFCLIVFSLLFFLAFVGQWNHALAKLVPFNYFLYANQIISKPIDPYILAIVPIFNKINVTNLIKLIICLLLMHYVKRLYQSMKSSLKLAIQKEKIKLWRSKVNIPQNNSLYMELEQKLKQISNTTDKKRSQQLYQEVADLKKKLESRSRYFAFLSMDVVDSTGMKQHEDKSLIQLDFIRFKRMIQQIFDQHNCVKSAWTPDGVMACFNTVDNAVLSAKESLVQLNQFNAEVKQISRDFIVRCGIHAGIIYYDEKLPLQEISDQVIDIAGHMQKYAEPGTIAISKQAIKPVDNTVGFLSNGKVVDEMEVYQWQINKD